MRNLILLALAVSAYAADPVSLLPEGDMARFQFNCDTPGKQEMGAVTGQSFTTFTRVSVRKLPKVSYAVNLLCPVVKPVELGDTLEIDLWARGEPGEGVSQTAIEVVHQLSSIPFAHILYERIILTDTWTRYRIAYRAHRSYAAETSRIALFFGAVAPQTIEVAAVVCKNHGPSVTPESLGIPVFTVPVP